MLRIKTYAILLVGALAFTPSPALADEGDNDDEEAPKKVRVFVPKEGASDGEVTIELGDGAKSFVDGRVRLVGPDGKVQEFDIKELMKKGADSAAPFIKWLESDDAHGLSVFFDEDMRGLGELFKDDADPAKIRELIRKHMHEAMRGRASGRREQAHDDAPCPHCGCGGAGAMGFFGDGTPPQLEEMLRGLMRGDRSGFQGMGPFGGRQFGPGRMHTEHKVRTFINDGSGWREVPQGEGARRMRGLRMGERGMGGFGPRAGQSGGRTMGGAPGMGGIPGLGGQMTPEHMLKMADEMQKRAEVMRKQADELKRQMEERRRKADEEKKGDIPPEIRKALEGRGMPFGPGMGGPGMGGPNEEQLQQQIKMLKKMLERLRKSKEAAEKNAK